MGVIWPARAGYRVRQFVRAVAAYFAPLQAGTATQSEALVQSLPPSAVALFYGMSPIDRRHSLNVAIALQRQGFKEPGLMQAALLHDCAKQEADIRLWHRVAMVLVPLFVRDRISTWGRSPAPARGHWRYPLWAHRNHPQRGAELAAAAGCEPLAVELIRRHQETPTSDGSSTSRLLSALQAADDDN